MKKYLVIGNPIEHSLSPQLHNYWLKKNNIEGSYTKKKIEEKDLNEMVLKVKNKKIDGINVTVPYKKLIIPFLDKLTQEAKETQSVNTIYFKNGKTIGHNTDIAGFKMALKSANYNAFNKTVFIMGAGGVVPSIIYALYQMKVSRIFLSNRSNDRAESIKKIYKKINIVKWGSELPKFDMIINATSLGLNKEDEIKIDYQKIGSNKFFYDVIYNPSQTNFLEKGNAHGNFTENGKMMFVYQAKESFKIWNNLIPEINNEVLELLNGN